jgi:hypothetical protein
MEREFPMRRLAYGWIHDRKTEWVKLQDGVFYDISPQDDLIRDRWMSIWASALRALLYSSSIDDLQPQTARELSRDTSDAHTQARSERLGRMMLKCKWSSGDEGNPKMGISRLDVLTTGSWARDSSSEATRVNHACSWLAGSV